MRKSILMLLAGLGLTGCATGPSLRSQMAAYIGDSPQTLVQKLGVPDKQITVNGTQYLAYDVRHSAQVENDDLAFGGFYGAPFYGPIYGAGFVNPGFPQPIQEYSCQATFMLKQDKVYDFTLRGNDCG